MPKTCLPGPVKAQLPVYVPGSDGAAMLTLISSVPPTGTAAGKSRTAGAESWSPLTNTMSNSVVQAQVPAFLKRQVLVNVSPGSSLVPSGMVTSETSAAFRQMDCGVGVSVAAGGM